MEVPERYCDYLCAEYFAAGWSERGYYDEHSQMWVILNSGEAYEERDIDFFAVGTSGCDGIDFGYRKGLAGIWAFYPIEREFTLKAATIAELVARWCSGDLKV